VNIHVDGMRRCLRTAATNLFIVLHPRGDNMSHFGMMYSGRKITESLGNVTVRGGGGKMERARGEHDDQPV